MNRVLKIYDLLIAALAVIAGASIVVITGFVVVDVLVRAAGWSPPSITSALVEYVLLYFALFSAPYLVRKKGHVVIDALVTRISGTPRIVIEKFAYTLSIATSLLFAWISLQLLLESIESGRFDERSIDIPMWLLYAPMPIGFFCVATEFARYLFGIDQFYQERTELKDSV